MESHTRSLKKGDRLDPLDLIEWLEDQGYEPEAQVTQKGEIALRGGIVDVYPLPSPWPVRLEFFGDELDSLRYFDPHTQISREAVEEITLPPAGELAFLKKKLKGASPELATLWEYLPKDAIVVLSDPAALVQQAEQYEVQVPPEDPFFCPWADFLAGAEQHGIAILNLLDEWDAGQFSGYEKAPARSLSTLAAGSDEGATEVLFTSLEAFRPQVERAADPEIAERQRREFFNQLHRWLGSEAAYSITKHSGPVRFSSSSPARTGFRPLPPGICSSPR